MKKLSFCLLFFQVFGMFQVLLMDMNKKVKKWISTGLTVYSIILLCFMSILMYLQSVLDDVETAMDAEVLTTRTILTKIFGALMFFGSFISFTTNIVNSILTKKLMKTFFKNLNKIEEITNNFITKLNFKQFFTHFSLTLGTVFVMFFITASYFASDVHLKLRIYLIVLPTFFFIMTSFQIIFLVLLINFFIDYVHSVVIEVLQVELANIDIQKRYKSKLNLKNYARQQIEIKTKIRVIWKIYNLIDENCEIVNNAMKYPILMEYIFNPISSVFSCYQLCLVLVRQKDIYKVSKGSSYVMIITLLTLICYSLICEMTSTKIKRILHTIETFNCEQKNLNEDIARFYTHLSVHPIKFTIAGIFDINLSLFAIVIETFFIFQVPIIILKTFFRYSQD